MHSTLVRAQNVFGFFTTVAFCVAALIAISVVISPQCPSASIELRNVQVVKGRPHYYSDKRLEYAHIKFDLDADFSSLFNWNTKQLFVYVTATYPSSSSNTSSSLSQAIIWDLIIPSHGQLHPFNPVAFFRGDSALPPPMRKSNPKSTPTNKPVKKSAGSSGVEKQETKPGIIQLKNTKPKYQITDISGRLAERGNVTLDVGWNVQPWVGALTWTMPEGKTFGRWKGVQGGSSEVFDLPALKGKKPVVVKEGVVSEKPEAAEASPVLR